jgi:hypothetical protein
MEIYGRHASTAPDAKALAHFYDPTCWSWRWRYEGPEGALVSGGPIGLMVQQISGYQAPAVARPGAHR